MAEMECPYCQGEMQNGSCENCGFDYSEKSVKKVLELERREAEAEFLQRLKRYWAGMSHDMTTLHEQIPIHYFLEKFPEITKIPDYKEYNMPRYLDEYHLPVIDGVHSSEDTGTKRVNP